MREIKRQIYQQKNCARNLKPPKKIGNMNNILIYLLRAFLILFFIFFVCYYFDIKNLTKNEKPNLYKIEVLTCKLRSGSSAGIYHNEKYYSIGIKKEDCYKYNLGDKISLYYNKKFDYFYVPNTLVLYERYIYASLFLVILSFLPLRKFKNMVFDYMDNQIKKKEKKLKK